MHIEPPRSPDDSPGLGSSKIQAFAPSAAFASKEYAWQRPASNAGTGATHVKSFHCKIHDEGLKHLDEQINEWLDQHPEFDVKFVTTTVGDWKAKSIEPAVIVQVWV